MSLNFPASPTIGEVYNAGRTKFIWNGIVWVTPGSGTPFPWARAADGADAISNKLVMTPEAFDATLDTFGPLPPVSIPAPQLMGGERVSGVSYQNTIGKPLLIAIIFEILSGSTNAAPSVFVGSTSPATFLLGRQTVIGGKRASVQFVVPVDWYYRVSLQSPAVFLNWWEYRL